MWMKYCHKYGMKLCLLTFNTSISVVAFTTCYSHRKLHHQTLDSLVTKFSTLTDSDIYWAKQCKEHHPIGCVPLTNMDDVKRNKGLCSSWINIFSYHTMLIKSAVQACCFIINIQQGNCMILPRIPTDSRSTALTRSIAISRPKQFTMYLNKKSTGESMTSSLMISTEYIHKPSL